MVKVIVNRLVEMGITEPLKLQLLAVENILNLDSSAHSEDQIVSFFNLIYPSSTKTSARSEISASSSTPIASSNSSSLCCETPSELDSFRKQLYTANAEIANLKNCVEELLLKQKKNEEEGIRLKNLVEKLSEDLNKHKVIHQIFENDVMTRFYTGLQSWKVFMAVFKLCRPGVEAVSGFNLEQCALELKEQFLLVLMRLRLNLAEQDLAYRFNISITTVSSYIHKWIDVMYVRLAKVLMVWPGREENLISMPSYFRKHFRLCVVIIDCFEVDVQRFIHLLDRVSTYSAYKGRNTIKFLIGISSQGVIIFISQSYGGRSTDPDIVEDKKYVAIAEDSNILTKLVPGDQVLADRGFLVEESVAREGAELITPAFKGRRDRLTTEEVENSRIVSNVRIHVERVIGQLRRTFTILEGKIKIDNLRADSDGLAFIDKIVFVCCCLFNCNSGVVPFS